MRAALALLLVFVFCGVPLSQVADAVPARVQRDIAAARALGAAFEWPSDERAADPTFAVEVLAEAAQAVGASVLRTSVSTGTDGRSRITHYVLSTGGTSLYRTLPLVEGRWPTDAESRHLGVVVSTEDTTSARIGRLQVLADGYALTVAPMAQAYESLPVAGTYVLEGADRATLDGFLARVGERLASRGAPPAVPTERASSGAADGSGSLLRFCPCPCSSSPWSCRPPSCSGRASASASCACSDSPVLGCGSAWSVPSRPSRPSSGSLRPPP